MTEISEWSPIDESNTAAPPNGWPENMAPSAVNNTARMMMGAIRRFFDWTTSNILALQTTAANALPLSGGSMSGPLSTPQLTVSGPAYITGPVGVNTSLQVSSILRGNTIVSDGNITAGGDIGGNVITGNAVASAGSITAADNIIGDALISNGNITAAGSVSATAFYDVDGLSVFEAIRALEARVTELERR